MRIKIDGVFVTQRNAAMLCGVKESSFNIMIDKYTKPLVYHGHTVEIEETKKEEPVRNSKGKIPTKKVNYSGRPLLSDRPLSWYGLHKV